MTAVKALIFGIDEFFPFLKPYYDQEVAKGNLEITGYVVLDKNKVYLLKNLNGEPLQNLSFQKVIISSKDYFLAKFKLLQSMFNTFTGGGGGTNIKLSNVIDGRIFRVPGFNLARFIEENVAYGDFVDEVFNDAISTIYKRIYTKKELNLELGAKSYAHGIRIEGGGLVKIGNFSSIAHNITFELSLNGDHNYHAVTHYGLNSLDWEVPKDYYPMYTCKLSRPKLNIGSDVWIGRGCFLKVSNTDKPLNIGNGVVIASDSVVVNDVPPFAIVGGNPAKFIKWRFDQDVIEALERIAWWNWDIEKIHDNFYLFNDPKKFASKFDTKN